MSSIPHFYRPFEFEQSGISVCNYAVFISLAVLAAGPDASLETHPPLKNQTIRPEYGTRERRSEVVSEALERLKIIIFKSL